MNSVRLLSLLLFVSSYSFAQTAAPMVTTTGEASPQAKMSDVVHPAQHPETMLIGPYQVWRFYHLEKVKNMGQGQTIALIGYNHDPNLDHDLAVFSQRFGLPQCTLKSGCLRQIDVQPVSAASQKRAAQPADDANHSYGEETMDVEWAHAIAPSAHLILMGGPGGAWEDTMAKVDAAVAAGATVVSLSLAQPQRAENREMYLRLNAHFTDTRASYVAAGGDHAHTARWPASSPDVVGVGGTTITTDEAGTRVKEVAWSKRSNEEHATATGGGLSIAESEPQYQITFGIPHDETHMRGTPDVSMYSTSRTAIAVYNSNVNPKSGVAPFWHAGAGTSAGTPMWAGLLAVANSMRAAKGKSSLAKYVGKGGNKGTLAAIYEVAKSTPDAFFDITEGTNGDCGFECTAQVGYDYLTGLGSPNGEVLLNALTALP